MTLRSQLLASALCLLASPLFAQITPPTKPDPPPVPAELFKETAPGILQLGLVTLEPSKRLIKIPATVSVKDGSVRYFLVGPGIKELENISQSVLSTQAQPSHLQQAMLFLGFKEQSEPIPASPNPLSTVTGQGVPVRITVHWQMDGKQKEAPAENWILNNKIQEPMPAGDWLYNSSKNTGWAFISLIADPAALINNPNPDRENHEIWKSRSDAVPPMGTMVEVHIQWPEAQQANLPPKPNEPLTTLPPAAPLTPAPTPSPDSIPK